MFDDAVRARFGRVATPVARALAGWGVSPTQVTCAGFALAVSGAAAIATHHPWVGLALWLVSRIADGLDGALARASHRQSAFGGYLDITLDMAAYSLMVLAFALVHPTHGVLWSVVLAGYVVNITTTLALAAAAADARHVVAHGNRSFQFTRGLAESGEASVVYVLWTVVPTAIPLVGWTWCLLLGLTASQRTWCAWRMLPPRVR